MKHASVSARSTVIVLLLLSASVLTACKPSSTRPESVPLPPIVQCAPAPMQAIPPIPPLADMDDWALQVLAILEKEATKGQASRTCEQGHRDKGVIR